MPEQSNQEAAPASQVLFSEASAPPPVAASNPSPAAPPPALPTIPDNWKELLDDDVKGHTSLEKIKDVKSLARSFINAQKMIGAEKVPLPPKGATQEQMKEFFTRVGLPKEESEYNVEIDAGVNVDKEFFDKFKKQAYSQNILPNQARGMVEWFSKVNDEAFIAQTAQYEERINTGLKNLKTEWGPAYDNEIAKAKAALREYADEDTQKFIQSAGLGNNPLMIKLLAKAGAALKEDKIIGEGGVGNGVLTPDQARQKIKEIEKDYAKVIADKNHPDSAKIRKERSALFAQAYPDPKG